jgi:hypothetical protein
VKTKTKLGIIGLCLTSVLIGYAIAEYIVSFQNTCRIITGINLELVWAADGSPVTAYDFGIMNDVTKNMPEIKIRNIGETLINVAWSSDAPAVFQLKCYNYNASGTVWPSSTTFILPVGSFMKVMWTLKDMQAPIGTYSFAISVASSV